jgi:PIN domain nuclease of toxin-antitoxin system
MRYLLDTHTFVWAVANPKRLSDLAHNLIENKHNDLFISPVSTWEMGIKFKAGKWPSIAPFLDKANYNQLLTDLDAQELPVKSNHTRLAGQFEMPHKDPFDRLLAAQAMLEEMSLITKDKKLQSFPVNCVW